MNQIQEVEKSLKRFLKKKVSFTGAFLVMFLITGGLSYSVNFYTDVVYNKSTDTTKPSREIIIGYKSENTNTGSAGSRLVSYYVPGRPMYEQNNPNPLTEAQIEAAIAAGKPLALHPYDNIRENDAQNNGKASLQFGKTIILGSNSKAGTSITIGDNAKSETSGITIGHSAIGAKNSLVVGAGAYTAQDAGMAIGRTATSLDVAGMSIGVASLSKSEGAMAIGNNATATGKYSIAIGTTEEFKSASTSANTNLVFKYTENTVTASGERAIAIGEKAKAEMKNSVVFGARAIADSSLGAREGGMALGTDSKSTANFATAVGTSAQATGTSSTALGTKAEASGLYSTALGGNTTASGNQSIAIGASDGGLINPNFTKAAGRLSTAIGVNTEVKSTADGSVALGNTTVVNGKDTIALGSKIISQEEKAVVLGYESTDRAATKPTSATIGTAPNTLTYSGFAGNAISVVSVGATGKERQIINVAPGEINKDSTDAINGSQLWATNNALGNLTNATKNILGGDAEITPDGDEVGNITMTNIGDTGKNNIHDAIKAIANNTISLGGDSSSTTEKQNLKKEDGIKFDILGGANITTTASENKVEVALDRDLTGLNSAGFKDGDGNTSEVTANGITITPVEDGKNPVNLTKDGLDNGGNKITNVAAGEVGENSTDAINGSQLHDAITNYGFNVIAGKDGTGTTSGTVESTKVSKDNTLTFKAGDNLNIEQAGKDFTYSLKKDIKLDSIKINDGPVLNKAGIDMNFRSITGLRSGLFPNGVSTPIKLEEASGETLRNAANIGDLQSLLYKTTWKIYAQQGDGGRLLDGADQQESRITNESVHFIAGKNLATKKVEIKPLDTEPLSRPRVEVTYELQKELTDLTSANFKNPDSPLESPSTQVTANGITITPVSPTNPDEPEKETISLTENGLDNGGNKVVNVAPGEISEDSKDAVNGSQLYNLTKDLSTLSKKTMYAHVNTGDADQAEGNSLTNEGTIDEKGGAIAVGAATLGLGTTAREQNALALGSYANAMREDSIAVGNGAESKASRAIAIGRDAVTGVENEKEAIDSVAIGSSSRAIMAESIAIGKQSRAGFIGDLNGQVERSSIAIGNKTSAFSVGSVALGDRTQANKHFTTAIGALSQANIYDNSVALGAYSIANTDGKVVAYDVSQVDSRTNRYAGLNTTQEGSSGKSKYAAVSVGRVGITRQITNVAGGTRDTDAVNVAQLRNVNLKFAGNSGKSDVLLDNQTLNIKGDETYLTSMAKGSDVIIDLTDSAKEKLKQISQNSIVRETVVAGSRNLTVTPSKDKNQTGGEEFVVDLAKDLTGLNSIKVGPLGADGTPGKDGVTIQGQDAQNGTDGKIGISGKDGKDAVSISGKDGVGTIGLKGEDGKSADIQVANGKDGLDGTNPDGKTRIVYEPKDAEGNPIVDKDGNPVREEVATLNDGLKFAGDNGDTEDNIIKKPLNEKLEILGGADKDKLSDNNIGVNANVKGQLEVKLAKELKDLTSATFSEPKDKDNPDAPTLTTTIGTNGVTITPVEDGKNPVSLTKDGLDNGGNTITNVAPGEAPTDAVNVSQLKKAADASKTEITANDGEAANATKGNVTLTSKVGAEGQTVYDIKLNDKITLGEGKNAVTIDGTTGEVKAGDVTINKDGNGTVNGLTNKTWDPKNIVSGQAATEDQLQAVDKKIDDTKNEITNTINNLSWDIASAADGGKVEGTTTESVKNGTKVTLKAGNNLELKQAGKDFTYSLSKDLKDLDSVQVGSDGKDGKPGVSINGKDGSIGLNGKDGKSANIQVANGKDGLDGVNPDGKTRIVYEPKDAEGNPIVDKDGNPVREEVATLNDGLKFKGDDNKVLAKPLNSQLDIVGGADKAKLSDNNIGVNANDQGQLEVKLAKELKDLTSAEFKAGDTTTVMNGNGVIITPAERKGSVSLTKDGLDNGGNKITNVAAGEAPTDAVNVSQLNEVKQVLNQYGDAINDNAQKIADLEDSTSRGIAGAMAQAGVKFQEIGINQAVVGAAISNYKGRSAVAAGIQVAPTENVRVHGIASAAPGRSKSPNFGVTVGASYRFNLK